MDRQIALAFPQMPPARRASLARRSLRSLADNLLDMVRGDRHVHVGEPAHDRLRALGAAGQPVIFLLAHLGAWELLGSVLSAYIGRFAAISANPHNDGVDRWLRRERARRGVRCFDRRRDRVAATRWLRDGGALALFADQRAAIEQVPAPWFGRPAPTSVGPIRLARRFGARLVPVGIRRDGDAHRLLLGEEIGWATEDSEAALLTKANGALEDLIRRAPDEWIWFHDRYGSGGREGDF
jgi:KDO2-lipid IV(A) lauroyltransferase